VLRPRTSIHVALYFDSDGSECRGDDHASLSVKNNSCARLTISATPRPQSVLISMSRRDSVYRSSHLTRKSTSIMWSFANSRAYNRIGAGTGSCLIASGSSCSRSLLARLRRHGRCGSGIATYRDRELNQAYRIPNRDLPVTSLLIIIQFARSLRYSASPECAILQPSCHVPMAMPVSQLLSAFIGHVVTALSQLCAVLPSCHPRARLSDDCSRPVEHVAVRYPSRGRTNS
jgi:hypothetical protein